MSFSSFIYVLAFLPAVVILCGLMRKLPFTKAPQVFVLLASVVFYGWAKISFLPYLCGSILVNWFMARQIAARSYERRKPLLLLAVVLNLLFLGTFKYLDFFCSLLPLHSLGWQLPHLAFVLGISFFTITQIMYLVDCYEEMIEPSSLFDHATFVAFFPYVISGPICRAGEIIEQLPRLNSPQGPSADTIARAVYRFSIGLAKKVVLADSFAMAADIGFANAAANATPQAWIYVCFYAFQLYFDFSGYSDMAIGSAMLLGIDLPNNFSAPLRSLSIIDFWRRWHITLSDFITTYLYTPILRSFSKATLETAAVTTLLSMTIAGLWHGANWTFVLFGLMHGLGLVINQYWRKKKMPALPDPLCWLINFVWVVMAFVFFRAANLEQALLYLRQMFSPNVHLNFVPQLVAINGKTTMGVVALLAQIAGILICFLLPSSDVLSERFKTGWKSLSLTAFCLLLSFLFLNSNISKPFVYFGF